ncbi:hypothetical protein YC2023_118449 [Brassica napus]
MTRNCLMGLFKDGITTRGKRLSRLRSLSGLLKIIGDLNGFKIVGSFGHS